MSSEGLNPNRWSRLRDDMDQLQRYDAQSVAPFNYTVSFGRQSGCSSTFADFAQCRTWAPAGDLADINNQLRFGEDYTTYEPGHPISTELVGRSPFVARGEGLLKGGIDLDTSFRSEVSNPEVIRARKIIEEIDLVSRKMPPLDVTYSPCSNIFSVVADNGEKFPRGGNPTRVILRNREKYVTR